MVSTMELEKVSPTDVEGFDPRSTFGCPTKFFFKTVMKIPEPGNMATQLGDEVHAQSEHLLATGENGLGKIAEPGLWFLEKVRPFVAHFEPDQFPHLKFKYLNANGRGLGIEMKFKTTSGYKLEGIPVTGRIDLLLDFGRAKSTDTRVLGVHDHKTSSNVEQYGKSSDDLLHNHQTSMYLDFCRYMFGWGKGENEVLKMSHGYFQTKGKKLFKPVETFVTVDQLDSQVEDTKRMIRAMKQVAKENSPKSIDKNLKACDVGFGCPYKNRCPRGVTAMSSMLSRFKKTTAPAVPAAPAAPTNPPAVPLPAAPTGVLAKDAPASNPAIAAQPPKEKKRVVIQDVEDAEIVAETPAAPTGSALANVPAGVGAPAVAPAAALAVEEKRGPGRPRGSKKFEEAAVEGPSLEFQALTIRHGLTVNLGDHNFAKVEVELSARFKGITLESVEKQVGDYVRAAVDRELEQYAQAADAAKS